MKTNRRAFILMLTILTVLAVFTTFSCSGLFTPPDSKPGMGNLTINLPGAGARASISPDDITHYSITIVDDTTGKIAVPPQVVAGGSLSLAVPVGNVSAIIVAMIQLPDGSFSMPYIGRKANIQVTENETVAATVVMIPIGHGIYEKTGHYPARLGFVTRWDSGTLPVMKAEGFTFDGWYSDIRKTEKISYFPDTTNYDPTDPSKFTPPVAHFTWLGDPQYVSQGAPGGNQGRKAGDSKYFYVAQDSRGDGKGFDAANAMAFSDMSLELMYFNQSNPDVIPEVIFITDVSFNFNHLGAVNITGKNNGQDGQRITITGTNSVILSLAGNAKDIIFDGKQSGTFQVDYGTTASLENCIIKNCTTGIDNSGTLTLSGCTIRDCSNNYSETSVGAINNSGWSSKLIIRNTIIDTCSGGKGGAIMTGSGSELDVDGLTISGCSAENGGGIYIDGSEKVTLKNCTITGCTAKENTSFEYHNQSYDGAGIYIRSGKLTLDTNCSISNCIADGNGNSIFCTVNSYTSNAAEVNGTSWTTNHWIDDEVIITSDLTAISSLWLPN